MPKKVTPRSRAVRKDSPAAPSLRIEARLDGVVHGFTLAFSNQKLFQQRAMEWSRRASEHQQFADRTADLTEGRRQANKAIQESGVSRQNLELMAQADVLQVCIPFTTEEEGWERRVMPWEYVIVQALKHVAPNQKTPCVVRHLMVPKPLPPPTTAPTVALGVISCPKVSEAESLRAGFERERQLVTSHLAMPAMEAVDNPTVENLGQLLQESGGAGDSLILHLLAADTPRPLAGSGQTVSHVWLPARGSGAEAGWIPYEAAPARFTCVAS